LKSAKAIIFTSNGGLTTTIDYACLSCYDQVHDTIQPKHYSIHTEIQIKLLTDVRDSIKPSITATQHLSKINQHINTHS